MVYFFFFSTVHGIFIFILIFFHYSWFTVFCQFSTVQQGDPVTHTSIHSFFSHYHACTWNILKDRLYSRAEGKLNQS